MDSLKSLGLGAFLAALVYFGIALSPASCSRAVGPENGKRVDTVLTIRHDTIKVLKDSLRTKIVYVDTGRIDTIEKILDAEVPPIGDENICISENQLRECVKCRDSLEYTKKVIAIDSQTIDTLSKLAKKVDTIKACSIAEQAKSFWIGTLFGIALRSLF